MEYQQMTNVLGTMLDGRPKFTAKKWVKVHNQSGRADDRFKQWRVKIFYKKVVCHRQSKIKR